MTVQTTHYFPFSASFKAHSQHIGHNYILGVTTQALGPAEEIEFQNTVVRVLIDQVHTRDLGEHVSFLKGKTISDRTLLLSFEAFLKKKLKKWPIHGLSLQKAGKTLSVLTR